MIRITKIFIALTGVFTLCSTLAATPAFAEGVTVGPARPGLPVRAANGDPCVGGDCVVVSERACAP